ncbi:MAG: NAD(P)H-quinone oxidoreductase [Alphaproteobacteria bacterium]
MTVVVCTGFCDPSVMRLAPRPMPVAGENEVLIKIAAAGVNRADLLQRKGKYPPPPGASEIMGLEVSGTVAALGKGVQKWKVGDKVCALLGGGGYAEYVTVPGNHCLSVPANISLKDAASLPEAILTVFANVFESAALKPKETVLIHGGTSSIGIAGIQMVKAHGAKIFVTVGSLDRMDVCRKMGVDLVVDYKREDFVPPVKNYTDGRGVDVILDMVGGEYIKRNLDALAHLGRHVSIASQGSPLAEIDVGVIMQKRLTLTGSTLRARDDAEKARLIAEVEAKVWPWVASGQIKPVIFQSFPLKNVAEAHKVMESGAQIGKIVLEVS